MDKSKGHENVEGLMGKERERERERFVTSNPENRIKLHRLPSLRVVRLNSDLSKGLTQ